MGLWILLAKKGHRLTLRARKKEAITPNCAIACIKAPFTGIFQRQNLFLFTRRRPR
jgi:hypothetical protein